MNYGLAGCMRLMKNTVIYLYNLPVKSINTARTTSSRCTLSIQKRDEYHFF